MEKLFHRKKLSRPKILDGHHYATADLFIDVRSFGCSGTRANCGLQSLALLRKNFGHNWILMCSKCDEELNERLNISIATLHYPSDNNSAK